MKKSPILFLTILTLLTHSLKAHKKLKKRKRKSNSSSYTSFSSKSSSSESQEKCKIYGFKKKESPLFNNGSKKFKAYQSEIFSTCGQNYHQCLDMSTMPPKSPGCKKAFTDCQIEKCEKNFPGENSKKKKKCFLRASENLICLNLQDDDEKEFFFIIEKLSTYQNCLLIRDPTNFSCFQRESANSDNIVIADCDENNSLKIINPPFSDDTSVFFKRKIEFTDFVGKCLKFEGESLDRSTGVYISPTFKIITETPTDQCQEWDFRLFDGNWYRSFLDRGTPEETIPFYAFDDIFNQELRFIFNNVQFGFPCTINGSKIAFQEDLNFQNPQ